MSGKTRTSFFEELRRRNVIRVVAAWVLIQIADTVFPYFGLADSTVTFLIIALAVDRPIFVPLRISSTHHQSKSTKGPFRSPTPKIPSKTVAPIWTTEPDSVHKTT